MTSELRAGNPDVELREAHDEARRAAVEIGESFMASLESDYA